MAIKKVQATPSATLTKRDEILEQVLSNMKVHQQRLGRTGLLLAGDPGVGKTSLVRQMSRMFGMNLVTIEAPHITEEHLINIPFVIYNKNGTGATEHDSTVIDPDTFHVKLATSNLASKLRTLPKISDEATLRAINADPNLKRLHQSIGGSDTELAPEIQEVREEFKTILFLDEYFRQTSGNVRNILRDILNGNIGLDKVPRGSYVIYASNMKDEGLDEVTGNTEFAGKIKMEAPSKEDWFTWLVDDAKKNNIDLKPEVVKAFKDTLEEGHINHHDVENEVRASPRRWEQVLHYISAALPVSSEHEASQLLTNVHHMFKNDDRVHKLEPVVINVVRDLIKKTSGDEHARAERLPDHGWRDTLEHQIKMKMKLGDKRSYIPVLSGPPGVGKTAAAADIAKRLALIYVPINAQTLAAEDVIGLPLPGKGEEGELAVRFSEPKLYMKIMQSIKKGEADLLANPEEYGLTADEAKAWKNRKAKYLIFFDELNRVKSTKEFNALRQTILEKKVGDHELPKESIVMAALNPNDKRTIDLTSHMRDVTDIIHTQPSWTKLKEYLEKVDFKRLKNPTVKQVALEIIKEFADEFGHKKKQDEQAKFHLQSGDDSVYMSPREYESLYTNLVMALDRAYARVDPSDYDDEDKYRDAIMAAFRSVLKKQFRSMLDFIFEDKHQLDNPEFMQGLDDWADDLDLGKSFKKRVKVTGLADILDKHLKNPKLHMKDDLDFVNYINNFDYVVFYEDLMKFVERELAKDAAKFVIEPTHGRKVLDKDKIKDAKEKVSALEHLAREMVHASKLHKLSNEVKDQIREAVHKAFMHAVTSDQIDNTKFVEALNIKQELEKFFKEV